MPPAKIQAAWTKGMLFSGNHYPAMTKGDDQIVGEVWIYDADDVPMVLKVLDEIEGTNQPGSKNHYDRVVVEAFAINDGNGSDDFVGHVHTYHFASDPTDRGFHRIKPSEGEGRMVSWPMG